ncbi:MAG: hypothetical protein AAF125_15240, partial [Chloroflexota bacterium]
YLLESNRIWQSTGTRRELALGFIYFSALRGTQGRFSDALDFSRQAAEIIRTLNDKVTSIMGYLTLGRIEMARPHHENALTYAERALAAAEDAANAHFIAEATALVGHTALLAGNAEAAQANYVHATERASAIGMRGLNEEIRIGMAYARAAGGDTRPLKLLRDELPHIRLHADAHQLKVTLDEYLGDSV